MKELYVGQKFKYKDKSIYMIVCISGDHTLICIKGEYAGCSYAGLVGPNIENVFAGNESLFKEIK